MQFACILAQTCWLFLFHSSITQERVLIQLLVIKLNISTPSLFQEFRRVASSILRISFLLMVCLPLKAETVCVATYNVYNYLELNRWADGQYRRNFPKAEVKKGAMRQVLQEMRPETYLTELQSDIREEGLDYRFQ